MLRSIILFINAERAKQRIGAGRGKGIFDKVAGLPVTAANMNTED